MHAASSQIARIKSHLEAGLSISPAEALTVYGTFRLASHIEKLRNKDGMNIVTHLHNDREGKQYGRYSLLPFAKGDFVRIKDGFGIGLPPQYRDRGLEVLGTHDDAAMVAAAGSEGSRWVNFKELTDA